MPLLKLVRPLTAELEREDGQTIIEYAFVVSGVSLAMLALFVTSGIVDDFAALVGSLVPD